MTLIGIQIYDNVTIYKIRTDFKKYIETTISCIQVSPRVCHQTLLISLFSCRNPFRSVQLTIIMNLLTVQ